MSETAVKEVAVAEPKEPIFSKKNRRLITDPFNDNNPITVQVLGVLFGAGCYNTANACFRDDTLSDFCTEFCKPAHLFIA